MDMPTHSKQTNPKVGLFLIRVVLGALTCIQAGYLFAKDVDLTGMLEQYVRMLGLQINNLQDRSHILVWVRLSIGVLFII